MVDREKVIKGLECLVQKQAPTANPCKNCGYSDRPNYAICVKDIASDAIALLKEQEVRELTLSEWREWKANPKRNPICELWENDTSPMWILNPYKFHEPALLMGKLKLFTGKPTFEQCKAVKWK